MGDEKSEEPRKRMRPEEVVGVGAKPLGEPIRVSGRGKWLRNHYNSFVFNGCRYDLEDSVFFNTGEAERKPYVALIKGISQKKGEGVMVNVQWFYRPEDVQKKAVDTRELFYSFHRDDVVAESVIHKVGIHFLPVDKQLPLRKKHPGFIVQYVYDTEKKILRKLADKAFDDTVQKEIDLLLQKTASHLGH